MINSKKKGFTIVELVIVIAVVAILAAVLIPTFSSLVRKANISSDTVLAKNLNTALSLYEAENEVKDFEDALKGIKENGYLIANLNAKTNGCFFVWEKSTNQILLVDSTDDYKVLFSVEDGYGEPGETWYFAISNKSVANKVGEYFEAQSITVNIRQTVMNMSDLNEVLSSGGEVYVDETIVLDDNNLICVDAADKVVTINLGNAVLNTNGILEDQRPLMAYKGTLNLNGGVVSATGSYVDSDEKVVNTPLYVYSTGKANIDGTIFNVQENGYLYLNGNNTIRNATINSEFIGVYSKGINVVENTTIIAKDRVIWACNHETLDKAGLITITSGKYIGGSSDFAAITTCGSFVKIEGGEFNANEGAKLFQIHDNNDSTSTRSTIVITGGTFNGIAFANINDWNSLCGKNTKAVVSDDGKTVTISYSAE